MTKKISLYSLFLVLPFFLHSQEMSKSYASVNYGRYTFFQSTRVKEWFSTFSTTVPSLMYNYPIGEHLSINTKIAYLNHTSVVGKKIDNNYKEAGITEYVVLPRLDYEFFATMYISLSARLGAYVGYTNNYYAGSYYNPYDYSTNAYRSENKYFSTGVSGGLGCQLTIPSTNIIILLNYDIHYARPGLKSMLLERDGHILDLGLGIIL